MGRGCHMGCAVMSHETSGIMRAGTPRSSFGCARRLEKGRNGYMDRGLPGETNRSRLRAEETTSPRSYDQDIMVRGGRKVRWRTELL
jgi:hypothetical protein